MKTIEAFETLISIRGWYKRIEGLNPVTARSYKVYLREGRLSIDKMEQILSLAGVKVIQEKLWRF